MPKFKFTVIETREYLVEYTVEADSQEEAEKLAENGETVSETTLAQIHVVGRQLTEPI